MTVNPALMGPESRPSGRNDHGAERPLVARPVRWNDHFETDVSVGGVACEGVTEPGVHCAESLHSTSFLDAGIPAWVEEMSRAMSKSRAAVRRRCENNTSNHEE
jgi:hypothetical protein